MQHSGLQCTAVDYEIISVGGGSARLGPGGFTDAWVTAAPTWRLVSGYLAVTADAGEDGWVVSSHGYPAARFITHALRSDRAPHGQVLRVHVSRCTNNTIPWTPADTIETCWSVNGVGFIPGAGTTVLTTSSDVLELACGQAWQMTMVHGPASVKINHRIALLTSLNAVGGRRG